MEGRGGGEAQGVADQKKLCHQKLCRQKPMRSKTHAVQNRSVKKTRGPKPCGQKNARSKNRAVKNRAVKKPRVEPVFLLNFSFSFGARLPPAQLPFPIILSFVNN
jgi:hypothetical protein